MTKILPAAILPHLPVFLQPNRALLRASLHFFLTVWKFCCFLQTLKMNCFIESHNLPNALSVLTSASALLELTSKSSHREDSSRVEMQPRTTQTHLAGISKMHLHQQEQSAEKHN